MIASRLRRSMLGWAAALVFVALAGLTVSGFLVTRAAGRGEEHRILRERAGEVSVLLGSASNGVAASLRLLGEVYAGTNGPAPAFSEGARSLLRGNVTGVGIAEFKDNKFVVTTVEGQGVSAGQMLTGDRAEVARRARDAKNVVSGFVNDGAPGRSTFVLAFGRADGRVVVFQESASDPTTPVTSTPDSPFYELNLALYRAPTATPDALVFTTTSRLPFSGTVDSRQLQVGAETWLMLTSAKTSLGGALASAVPWFILGGGLIAALIMAGVVGVLAHRRRYASAQVEERTEDLRFTLSKLEAARETADDANRSKSAFLSRMSHELRTPLNAVLGFAQVLRLGELDHDQDEAVHQILKGGKHLLQLINEVLDISRIETGELQLSSEAVLVSTVLRETADLIRPLAAERSIHIVGDRQNGSASYVFADRQRLTQILLNLLSNAVKFNHRGGTVALTCEQLSTRLRIKVTDSGPGIRPDLVGLLFTPFERLGADRTDVEGTGIGLALSRRLAEAMGGTLDVETVFGQGSTFWVELPVVEGPVERYDRLQSDTARTETTVSETSTGRQTVLYIEDNLANLLLVQRVMKNRDDVEIIPAMQGRLGIDLARQHRPVLILLDLHLPDMPGDEILQLLRVDPETATIPVVIISADATQGQIQRLLAAGASDYLTKPFDVSELVRIIDAALSKGQLTT